MKKSMSKMLIFVSIFFFLIFGWYGAKKVLFWWFMSHYTPPAPTISASPATNKTWQPFLRSIGTLYAINGVDLSAEIAGIIEDIRFNSGKDVKQGEVVIVMRTNLERAALKNNQAKLQLSQMNYDREQTLFNKKVSSKASLDARSAELQQAQAGVESIEAQIAQKTIMAPFSGRLGIRQVNIGQYVAPGTVLVTLQSLDPLYVNFSLPENYLSNIHNGQSIDITVSVGEGKTVMGKITAINAKVDPVTRNVLVQATIPNENLALYPGMYGTVKIWLQPKPNTIIVPQTAISYSLSGDYVFLLKEELKSAKEKEKILRAYRQYVKVGERNGNDVVILDGLKPGDRVITSGQLKVQNGAVVLVDENVKL